MAFGPLTKTPHDVYSPIDGSGQQRSPVMQDAEVLATETLARIDEVDKRVDEFAVDAGSITLATWAELDAVAGTRHGQRAEVTDDAGTHTDPVVSGTVANEGIYSWILPDEGWQRVADRNTVDDPPVFVAAAIADGASKPAPVDADKFGYLNSAASDAMVVLTWAQLQEAIKQAIAVFNTAPKPRDGILYSWLVKDAAGNIGLAIQNDRRVILHALQMGAAIPSGRDGQPYVVQLFHDREGKGGIGVDEQGRIDFVPAPALLARLDGGANFNFVSPDDLGLNADIDASRPFVLGDGGYLFDVNEMGRRFTARRLSSGMPWTGFVSTNGAVHAYIFYGQSNVGTNADASAPAVAQSYKSSVVSFSSQHFVHGENALNPANLTAVAPLSDAGLPGDMLDRLTMYALQQFQADDLAKLPGHFAFTVYYGGEPLETFEKGGDQYAKVITAADRATAVFDQQFERDVSFRAVHFTQGEEIGNYSSRGDYTTHLKDLADDLRADIPLETGQGTPPVFAFFQTSPGGTADHRNRSLAQYDASFETGLSLIGPMYQLPVHDGVHMTLPGKMMQAEISAAVFRTIERAGTFTPLRPSSVTRSGADVDAVFVLPDGKPLQFDSDWVPTTGLTVNKGFSAFLAADDTPLTVSSVTLVDDETVRVTLSADPGGAVKLAYGLDVSGAATGWVPYRGLLYSDSRYSSFFHKQGYAVPEIVRHYAVRFEEETAS